MTKPTTHDLQTACYVQEYKEPETTTTTEGTALDSEIAALRSGIELARQQLAGSQATLERLTAVSAALVQKRLTGTTQ